MNLDAWIPVYERILREYGFSRTEDEESCRILSERLSFRAQETIPLRFRGKRTVVIGNSPSLEDEFYKIGTGLVIVAGSAISTYHSRFGCPEIAVTDLDGDIETTEHCISEGTVTFVHAHGDNVDRIKNFRIPENSAVFGTCQCMPLHGSMNFGGFTDGDRAAFLADYLESPRIELVGFDFSNVIERTPAERKLKLKKMKTAKMLIDLLYRERIQSYGKDNLVIL